MHAYMHEWKLCADPVTTLPSLWVVMLVTNLLIGLRFTGRYSEDGKPLTVHVDDVVPGSIAALSGQIGEGDRIVRVNGCSLTGVELERCYCFCFSLTMIYLVRSTCSRTQCVEEL